jgi:hypothetical protein
MRIREIGMSHVATHNSVASSLAAKAVLPVMAATICLSAFLLFSVQPFFAKMVLPKLGGSPAVWSIAMVFFQAVLLAGYGYAHLLSTKFPFRTSVIIHLAVMIAALAFLPVSSPDEWSRPPETGHAIWLIGLFSISIGLPFFAISANSSLLQSWFSRTGHSSAQDPYFLYGASNIGSFASLILYVILFEPLATLSEQNTLWTCGFLILLVLIGLSGYLAVSAKKSSDTGGLQASAISPSDDAAALQVTWHARLIWIGYAFIPSALLVAVTAYIQTDVAAAPFLWLVPLALFLLTFVIVFQKRPLISHRMAERAAPVLVIPLLFVTLSPLSLPLLVQIFAHLTTFFVVALCAHGALASRRPDATHLTEFYFCMSFGGVLGGIFSSLVAMHLFTWIAEYPLLLIVSLLAVPRVRGQNPATTALLSVGGAIFVGGLLILLGGTASGQQFLHAGSLLLLNLLLAGLAFYLLIRQPKLVLLFCSVMFVNFYVVYSLYLAKTESRSFFGVLRVVDDADKGVRKFLHGTTLHGATRIADVGESAGRPVPLTYYSDDGGMNLAIEAVRKNLGGKLSSAGVIGVGAGSLACQFNDGEKLDLFEIDPEVIRIAKDPELFPFLSKCAPTSRIIVGDGRIEIAGVSDGSYDVLVVDAFSSDSIPVHLLTLEAIELYMRKLSDEGVLVLHISNKHLELTSVVGAIAKQLGLSARVAKVVPENTAVTLGMAASSNVAVIARDDRRLGHILDDKRWTTPNSWQTAAWTDGYSNLIAALWRKSSR